MIKTTQDQFIKKNNQSIGAQIVVSYRGLKQAGLKVPLVITIILTLMGYWTFLGMPADLASHFKLQYAVIQAICLVAMLIHKKPQWVLLAILGLVPNLEELSQWYAPRAYSNHSTKVESENLSRIKLMQMNVKTENQDFEGAMHAIQEANPDIISLQEVDDKWLTQLKPVLKNYAYYETAPRNDHFGIALYSRIPLETIKVRHFGSKNVHPYLPHNNPTIVAKFSMGKQQVTVISTHPFPPGIFETYYERNQQLMAIARAHGEFGHNLIVIGDLNTTAYSDIYKQFTNATGLMNANRGFGVQHTWPSFFPLMWIPIDHVLVSESFLVLDHKTGPFIGSDHLPLVVELVLKPQGKLSARLDNKGTL